ncbi:hypothetical protein GCK32_002031 [Trichostrongylus colubriformis]|uniref:CCHC-type domain-containing protein n=1 Tax=Trichostrongylus colubriformis TaxID=6319 RepID=A0AAN8ENW5_TRICO
MKATSLNSRLALGKLLEELHEQVSSRALFENRYASLASSRAIPEKAQRQTTFKQEQCLFCHKNNHQTKDCRTVRTPVDRRNALRGQIVCWKCFARDHRSSACTLKKCPKCSRDHHISLCSNQTDETPTTTLPKSQGNARKASESYDRESGKPKNTYRNQTNHTNICMAQPAASNENEQKEMNNFSNQLDEDLHEKNLILMTVEGQIKNNTTGSFENVLIFLDSGAQCNLIDAHLADTLALARGEPYQYTMHGIGGTIHTYTAQQVTAVFRIRFGECVSINLSTKPVLTNAFPSATLTSTDIQFLKQNNIFLSNTAASGQLVKPTILIGVESYEHIVLLNSPPTKLPSGLLAQNTVFGPALFGRLELLAILISLRLAKTILRSYKGRIKLVRIVNDSKIALAWIQTTKRLPLFVANQVERIKKLRRIIHQHGALVEFNYVESKNNPADVATRPTTKEAFEASDWLPGPQWFKTQEASWPIESSIDLNEMVGNESHDEGCNTPICAPAVKTSTQINDSIWNCRAFGITYRH